MTTPQDLAALMFPENPEAPAHWESLYPPRNLPEGASVTRFAPSPTGDLHTGGLYAAIVAQDLASFSRGTFFVRIEDTDQARENKDSRAQFDAAFAYFGIEPDEGDDAPWGPYVQSERAAIYAGFAKSLVEAGKAYPCFCTSEELEAMANQQRAAKIVPGYYGEWAKYRDMPLERAAERIAAGDPYVVRFRAPGGEPARVAHGDLIRGRIEQLDNRNDAVILKSSANAVRLPTYHFAHAIDDHLMRVNTVTRGEEWLPSLPLHYQLFAALGFDVPAYAHIAPLMTIDGASKRKLSKRKDPEASVDYYMRDGYLAVALRIYLRGLANGNLADIDFTEAAATPIDPARMGVAGPIFDPVKLQSISRNYVAELSPGKRLAGLTHWAEAFDPALSVILAVEGPQLQRAFELEAVIDKNPRKDIGKWTDVLPGYRVFLPSVYEPVTDPAHEGFAPTSADVVRAVLADFARDYIQHDDRTAWFEQVRSVAAAHGFAPSAGEWKREPDKFIGSIGEASNIVRIALTGARQSADLFLVTQVIGEAEVLRRLRAVSG